MSSIFIRKKSGPLCMIVNTLVTLSNNKNLIVGWNAFKLEIKLLSSCQMFPKH